MGTGRIPGLLTAQLQVGATYQTTAGFAQLWYLMPSNGTSHQSPSWFPQEVRPVVRMTVFTGTVLQTLWPLFMTPPPQHLMDCSHAGLVCSGVTTVLFLLRPVLSLFSLPEELQHIPSPADALVGV